jgi:hypothetical protein
MDATKAKPTPQEVEALMRLFPRCDYLMCETLLMLSEEQLASYVQAESTKK